MDIAKKDHQRVTNIFKMKLLTKSNFLTVGSIIDRENADIEDLFTPESYIKLVNSTYHRELQGCEIKLTNLSQEPRIIKKLEKYFSDENINNGNFSHYRPAYELMMKPEWQSKIFDENTLANFKKAISAINGILKKE